MMSMNSLPVKSRVVTSSPDVLSGTPVFAGTRVPVQTLIDYLEAGDSIDEFLAGFPTVTREQIIEFLEEAKTRVLATVI
jgi:uncharacterized protein (DUF433 family)